MNEKQELLKIEYQEIFRKVGDRPEWAVKRKDKDELVHPSIPFIGEKYNQTKLLLYASAENLAEYGGRLDDKKKAINRHRLWFNNCSDGKFFPDVHITPINNGALVIVVAYILKLLGINPQYSTPRELIEKIAFANFGKFSLIKINKKNKQKNVDYARDLSKLSHSLNYVKKDLDILKPDIVVMPKTIYNHKKIETIIKSILPESRIIPIYQINVTNINCRIRIRFKPKNKENIGILSEWQTKLSGGITGCTNENFCSVYTYLEELINE